MFLVGFSFSQPIQDHSQCFFGGFGFDGAACCADMTAAAEMGGNAGNIGTCGAEGDFVGVFLRIGFFDDDGDLCALNSADNVDRGFKILGEKAVFIAVFFECGERGDFSVFMETDICHNGCLGAHLARRFCFKKCVVDIGGICAECGMEAVGGCWKLIGGVAYYMHSACADKVTRDIVESEEYEKENRTGNYFTGLIGALLGAAIGAVLWAVVLYFGWVASIIGLAVGFLAEKGYNLFRGKQGKGKVVILILAVIFGVIVGNFGADIIALAQMIAAGEAEGWTYADIPLMMVLVLVEDPEYLMFVLKNIGMGLLFAGLGVWSQMRRVNAEVSGVKVLDLK